MRQLNSVYTQIYNKKHDLSGPVFRVDLKAFSLRKSRSCSPSVNTLFQKTATGRLSSMKNISGVVIELPLVKKSPPEFLYIADVLAFFWEKKKVDLTAVT